MRFSMLSLLFMTSIRRSRLLSAEFWTSCIKPDNRSSCTQQSKSWIGRFKFLSAVQEKVEQYAYNQQTSRNLCLNITVCIQTLVFCQCVEPHNTKQEQTPPSIAGVMYKFCCFSTPISVFQYSLWVLAPWALLWSNQKGLGVVHIILFNLVSLACPHKLLMVQEGHGSQRKG